MPLLGEARIPPGIRIYAMTDIHGHLERLCALHEEIDRDLACNPTDDPRLVYCGDYIDRGPDSAGVIDMLVSQSAQTIDTVFLSGNHEEMLEGFLADPVRWGEVWIRNGADETMRSYGVEVEDFEIDSAGLVALGAKFSAAVPDTHRDFIANCPLLTRFGDFVFVHAGIRPGIPIEDQHDQDLVWIREQFHADPRDHGAVIVHGHTPVDSPDVQPNRINIDTGAGYGGPLTCLVIEGTEIRFLSV